ncbi:MAG: mechanosensitive ion channel family protein [Candidatus Bathyarchaeia archaeon]
MWLTFILEDLFVRYPLLITVIWLLVVVIVAVVVERIVSRWVNRFAKRTNLPPHAGNALVLTSRFIIFVGGLIAVLNIGGVSADIIVAFSALSGAAIGFASTQTVGNIIAGLYILVSRPFRVGDYVKLDGAEGIVKEVSINYTKILTAANNIVCMSNRRILDRDVVNFRYKGESKLFRYGFEINFDHSLPTEKIEAILEKVAESYAEKLPRKPEYQLGKLTRFDKNYMFYIYVEHPQDVFALHPRILKEIAELWDALKKGSG